MKKICFFIISDINCDKTVLKKLSKKETAGVELLASNISKEGMKCDEIIVSNDMYSLDTAEKIIPYFKISASDIKNFEIINNKSTSQDLLSIFSGLDNNRESIIFTGHFSIICRFINTILDLKNLELNNTSVFQIKFNTNEWKNISAANCEIGFYKLIIDNELNALEKIIVKNEKRKYVQLISNVLDSYIASTFIITHDKSKKFLKENRKLFKKIIQESEIITITDLKNIIEAIEKINNRINHDIEKKNSKIASKLEKEIEECDNELKKLTSIHSTETANSQKDFHEKKAMLVEKLIVMKNQLSDIKKQIHI